jgi:hypothetical protein
LEAADLIDTAALGSRGVVFHTGGVGSAVLYSALGLGDFDGDGFDDVLTSSNAGREVGSSGTTVLSLVFGHPELTGRHLLGDPSLGALNLRFENTAATGDGRPLQPPGDLDGDSFADVLLGAPEYEAPDLPPGRVWLLRGAPDLKGDRLVEEIGETIRGTVFYSSDDHSMPGQDGTVLGDFNGDGGFDLAILGYHHRERGFSSVLFVIFRAHDMPAKVDVSDVGGRIPGFVLYGPLGYSSPTVARSGDVNGDGLEDLLILAHSLEAFGPAYVFLLRGRRDPEPLIDLYDFTLESLADHGIVVFLSPTNGRHLDFGNSQQAAGIGDLNGDGFDDLLIGASYGGFNVSASTARIFYGRGDLPPLISYDNPEISSALIHSFRKGTSGDLFGRVVAPAGDMNVDGVPDILLSAPNATVDGKDRAGEAYLIFGERVLSPELFLAEGFSGMRVLPQYARDVLGWFLGSAGDFNSDGAPDTLVGVRPLSTDPPNSGRAYIIYGTGTGEPPLTVLRMEPASGPLRGGTAVRISGSGFRDGLAVRFGDQQVRTLRILSPTELEAVAPAADRIGPVAVTLTLGAESRVAPEVFEYTPNLPEIDLNAPGVRGLRLDGEERSIAGHALAFSDVNSDGEDDLLVASIASEDTLRVSIVRGGPGLPEVLPLFDPSPRVSQLRTELFPIEDHRVYVAAAGDVNGDGLADFAFANSDNVGFLLFGRRDLPEDWQLNDALAQGTAVRLVPSPGALEAFRNWSFVPVGDLTGDGIEDLAVGLAFPTPGRVLFIAGRETWPETIDLHEESFALLAGQTASFGYELAVPGDVDGDGVLDLLACCEEWPDPEPVQAFLLPLALELEGELAVQSFTAEHGGTIIERAGREWPAGQFVHAAVAGDVNADGRPDLVFSDEGGADSLRGITFLVPGRADLPVTVSLSTQSPEPWDGITRILGSAQRVQSGRALGQAGDWNGDGFEDFLVGEQNIEPFDPGNMFIVLGERELPAEIRLHRPGRRAVRLAGTQRTTRLDNSTPRAADLNGDGREDFAFSETSFRDWPEPDGTFTPGAVHVVYGIPTAVPFIRGDANFDGRINISDPVFTLAFLFTGGGSPYCADAADADDSGGHNITDAIATLNHLFLGAEPLPAPYPREGEDPTADGLGCLGY